MNIHVKIVAALHIVFGVLGLIGMLVIFAVFGMTTTLVLSEGERTGAGIIGFVALCVGGLIALLSIPGIIGGWGLLAQKSWARILVIVLGFLDLLNFPFGTILGVYTLWALLRNEGELQRT